MKQIIPVTVFLLSVLTLPAQTTGPVQWSFSCRKKAERVFEVRVAASIAAPWHIYSVNTPAGGPLPTKLRFSKNPLVTLEGEVQEAGTLIRRREEVFDLDTHYFEQSVEFVQTVKLSAPPGRTVQTTLTGTVEYMLCNDRECLPPRTVPFTVALP